MGNERKCLSESLSYVQLHAPPLETQGPFIKRGSGSLSTYGGLSFCFFDISRHCLPPAPVYTFVRLINFNSVLPILWRHSGLVVARRFWFLISPQLFGLSNPRADTLGRLATLNYPWVWMVVSLHVSDLWLPGDLFRVQNASHPVGSKDQLRPPSDLWRSDSQTFSR